MTSSTNSGGSAGPNLGNTGFGAQPPSGKRRKGRCRVIISLGHAKGVGGRVCVTW